MILIKQGSSKRRKAEMMKNLNIARRDKATDRQKIAARYASLQRQHEYCLNTAAYWQAQGEPQIAANWMKDAEMVAKKVIKMAEQM